jgi:hypothetical protein
MNNWNKWLESVGVNKSLFYLRLLFVPFLIWLIYLMDVPESTCYDSVNGLKKDTFSVVVIDDDWMDGKPYTGGRFDLSGKNPSTQKEVYFRSNRLFYSDYQKYISVGDTVIKHRGESGFEIHKNGQVLYFYIGCEKSTGNTTNYNNPLLEKPTGQ